MNDISHNIANQSPDAIACRLMQKTHNRDGLPEIAIGVFFLLIAGMMWLTVVFPPRSPINIASTLGMMLTFMALPLGLQWALNKVRGKFLMDKFGYVKLKPANRKRTAIVFVIAFAVAAATAFVVYTVVASRAQLSLFPPDSWILAGTGIGGGILFAVSGRLPRFVVGGIVMAVTGILVAFSGVSLGVGFTILYGIVGAFALVSGVVVLSRFLHQLAEPAQ